MGFSLPSFAKFLITTIVAEVRTVIAFAVDGERRIGLSFEFAIRAHIFEEDSLSGTIDKNLKEGIGREISV